MTPDHPDGPRAHHRGQPHPRPGARPEPPATTPPTATPPAATDPAVTDPVPAAAANGAAPTAATPTAPGTPIASGATDLPTPEAGPAERASVKPVAGKPAPGKPPEAAPGESRSALGTSDAASAAATPDAASFAAASGSGPGGRAPRRGRRAVASRATARTRSVAATPMPVAPRSVVLGLPTPSGPVHPRRGRRVDRRLVPAALVVFAGTAAGLRLGWVWAVVVGCVAALGGLVWFRLSRRRRPHRIAAVAVVLCGIAVAGLTGSRLHHDQVANPLVGLAARNAFVRLRVAVTDQPTPIQSVGFAGRPGGVRSVTVQADAVEVTVGGRTTPVDGPVLLIAPTRGWSTLVRGQQTDARGELETPLSGAGRGALIAVVRVRGAPANTAGPSPPDAVAQALRQGLRAASAGLPGDTRGLLPALVAGDRSGLNPAVLNDFRRAGMAYLLAVGGLHFVIVCGAVVWLLRRFGVGPWTRSAVGFVVLLGYLDVAGPRPNVLRAALMVTVGLLAVATGRSRSTGSVLAGSVIVLTLWHPEFGGDLGFALSVAATGAMVALARPLAAALRRRRVPPGIAKAVAIAVVAQVATAPLIAAAYGEFSVPALFATILAEPAFVPAMLVGALALGCAPVWPWLAGVVAHAAVPELDWLLLVAHHAAGLPAAALPWPTGWWGGLALAAVAVALLVAMRFRRLRALLAAVVVGIVLVLVPVQVLAPGWPPTGWAMVDCDVGQGDGEVLATGDPGRAVVVDTGPDPTAMDECLGLLGVTRVPLVMLSHLHADHVTGLAAVLRDRSVGAVAVGPSRVPAWAWTQVVRETAAAGVPLVELSVGQRLSWPGLALDVVGPPPGQAWPSGDDPSGTVVNNASLVLRATTAAGSVLLTGDVELEAQADLLQSHVDLSATILKVPHHGSRFSSPAFLDAVHARVAVASVGAGNPYGHPSPLTLGRLSRDGALVLRTDHDGDVAIVPGARGPTAVPRGDPRPSPHAGRRGGPTGGG